MANLKETAQWEEGIYQIETSDPVMGGENGIDNKPLRQLANRTAYLKQELANATAATTQALNNKANQSHAHTIADITGLQAALNAKLGTRGLLNETDLDTLHGSQNVGIWAQNIANRATLERHYPIAGKAGTLFVLPSAYAGQQVYLPMGESVLYRRHAADNLGTWGAWESIGGQAASLTRAGLVQLSSAIDSDLETTAATSKAVKTAFDRATEAEKKSLPVGAIVAFPKAIANPTGYLKADGSTFDAATYPDLYKALGNKNTLPDLTRSDVGMTAYFPIDQIPQGWLAFDDIASQVTASAYPELHALLIRQYGSLDRVPQAQDRFIRNASGSLKVGQVQEDAIRNISGDMKFIEMLGGVPSSGAFAETEKIYAPRTQRNSGAGYTVTVGFDASRVVPTAEENRPKSLVLKLCIKARNSLDDVQFWIKAYGQIQSSGSLNAAALAADIHNLRREMNQTVSQTARDLTEQMAQTVRYRKVGDFEIRQFADGTMVQTVKISVPQFAGNDQNAKSFTWALAFTEAPTVTATVGSESVNSADVWITLDSSSTGSQQKYWLWEATYHRLNLQLYFTAVGRWK